MFGSLNARYYQSNTIKNSFLINILTLSCTGPPALKGPFITPVITSDDFAELKLFIALAWDCDWDDIDDDNDVILLLWLFPTPDGDNDGGNTGITGVGGDGGTVSLTAKPLLSNGAVWEGMEGFPTLWLETEFTVVFIEEVPRLFTNTLLDTLVLECPDTWLLNAFDWLFESENNNQKID